MRLFKTRREVQRLQRQVDDLTAMLKAHFGIIWTLDDFSKQQVFHYTDSTIPVTEGELIHYAEMLSAAGTVVTPEGIRDISYRGKPVVDRSKS